MARVLAVLMAFLLGAPALAQQQEPRWALVIGNDDYEHVGDLGAAVADAAAMEAALKDLGFEVLKRPNLSRAGIYRAVRQLAERAGGAIVVVYYAGHGVQIGGRNYLLPVDIEATSEGDVEDNAVPIDDVLNLLGGAKARLTVAFLDACRDNPLPPSVRAVGRGLARDATVPRGQMVVYSAGPGERALDNLGGGDTHPNGLFVRELIPELKRAGVPLDRAVEAAAARISARAASIGHDQNPAIYKAYYGEFSLRAGQVAEPPRPPGPQPGFDPRLAELAFWDSVKDSARSSDFQAYLDRYGDDGLFTPLARSRLAAVTPGPAPAPEPPAPVVPTPEEVEAGLGLSPADWSGVQRALTALGFDTRGADGRPGPNTRRAVLAWQESKGAAATGYLAGLQRDLLLSEAQPRLAAVVPPRPVEPEPPVRPVVGVYGDAVRNPGEVFRDCAECPELVVVPSGSFTMGSPAGEEGRDDDEGPQHRVTIARPFAVGRYEVTRGEWSRFVTATWHKAEGGCHVWTGSEWKLEAARGWRDPGFAQTERDPVACVSWENAQAYVRWLSGKTGEVYRLLSEAEWEYVARAGTETPFWTGSSISTEQANYDGNSTYGSGRKGEYRERTVPAGSLPANPWGLHEVLGNVWEWVEDCYHESYAGAPSDGRSWSEDSCPRRVLRGGSFFYHPRGLRAAFRVRYAPDYRFDFTGLRVARTFTP